VSIVKRTKRIRAEIALHRRAARAGNARRLRSTSAKAGELRSSSAAAARAVDRSVVELRRPLALAHSSVSVVVRMIFTGGEEKAACFSWA
jgi:hypothetical protein